MSTEHRIVLVYGNFNDPATKQNFFMIRIPEGRVPWSKKIAPALDRMIRGWYTPEQHAANRASIGTPRCAPAMTGMGSSSSSRSVAWGSCPSTFQ